ncbi:MAG: hypothetical protein BWY76_01030 [bacterium ADurb.Bin429]|nr:MAG: hypothetical protein BWY76_01030 [bacterium ADurb.Bin429]
MHDFDDTMTSLGIAESPASWREYWEEAQATFPADGPDFLTDAYLREVAALCDFPEDILPPLAAMLARARGDERLSRLAWLWRVVLDAHRVEGEIRRWPSPAGEPLFSTALVLAEIPAMLKGHTVRGIPLEVSRATLRDLPLWMRNYRRRFGEWGFDRLGWMIYHLAGQLYRVGRMQYIHKPNPWPVSAYRHRERGEVAAFFKAPQRCRRDGLIDGTNGVTDSEAFTALFTEDGARIAGHPITRAGYVQPEPVTLSLADWQRVLCPGDPVLDVHIPADGRMDYDACGASVQAAPAFFARHFPEKPAPVAFICYTWLLDAQYAALLPAESNIVRWQREFHAFPVLSDDLDPFFRVFDGKPTDLVAAPRDTALRRAMLDTTLAGKPVRCAGGFILIDGMTWGR